MTDDAGRIVVVDDSWTILEQVRSCLAAQGYEVRTTTSPDVAAKLAGTADLAIVDFHMPGMNGNEVVRSMRDKAGPESPCLFYLYTSDPEAASRYRQHGFDGALLKKGEEQALVPQVEAVFRTVKMRKLATKLRQDRGASVKPGRGQ